MRLSRSMRDLGASTRNLDDILHERIQPSDLERYARGVIGKMDMVIVEKPDTGLRLSKMTTTYYRQIRVRVGFYDQPTVYQAVTLMHEITHARHWRQYSPVIFATSYALRPGFRWAMECQAYTESVRARRAVGFSEEATKDYIRGVCERFERTYSLRNLRNAGDILETHLMAVAK